MRATLGISQLLNLNVHIDLLGILDLPILWAVVGYGGVVGDTALSWEGQYFRLNCPLPVLHTACRISSPVADRGWGSRLALLISATPPPSPNADVEYILGKKGFSDTARDLPAKGYFSKLMFRREDFDGWILFS